jgi:hypothetical protein
MPTIEQLQNLIKKRLSPDEILFRITEKPVVNTFKEQFKNIIEFVDIVPLPGKEKYFHPLKKGNQVIYWKLAENDIGVEIIGIIWDEEFKPRILCGNILPP